MQDRHGAPQHLAIGGADVAPGNEQVMVMQAEEIAHGKIKAFLVRAEVQTSVIVNPVKFG